MTTPLPPTFDIAAPLATPLTVIEASAGTGKTHALSGLAVRALAAGDATAAQLLVVTFTRAATTELRDRIRRRLADTIAALDRQPEPDEDALVAAVRAMGPDARRALQIAQVDFDDLTVSTIHSFAHQVLAGLGDAAEVDPDLPLEAERAEEVRAACADTLAAAAAAAVGDTRLPDLAELTQVVFACRSTPDLELRPNPFQPIDDAEANAAVRRDAQRTLELADEAITRLDVAHAHRGVRTFDAALVELRDVVRNPRSAGTLAVLRDRYRVVLIDEFQDTDPVQWGIFSTVFAQADSGCSVVVVGDPKQAIYRFRGADLATYTSAVSGAAARTRLATNWRSDRAMLDALAALFDGVEFGGGARFAPVEARPGAPTQQLVDAAGVPFPAVALRLAIGDNVARATNKRSFLVPAVREAIVDDLVAQLIACFEGGYLPDEGAEVGFDGTRPRRAVHPSDIAVLVSTAANGRTVVDELRRANIPAVLRGGQSVLESRGAAEWRQLLDALAVPTDLRRVRAASLGAFGVFDTVADLQSATEAELDRFQARIATWARVLATAGVAELVPRVVRETDVVARALSDPDGDRLLTDLEHVGDLLQLEVHRDPQVLAAGLVPDPARGRIDSDDPRARRVESDADAVQVMTMHVAKGLEFPIVCAPDLYAANPSFVKKVLEGTLVRAKDLARYHDPDGAAVLELAPSYDAVRSATVEDVEDRLRLAYVALTRAKHHVIAWWSKVPSSGWGPLTRLLYADVAEPAGDGEPRWSPTVTVPDVAEARALLDPLIRRSGGTITATVHDASLPPVWNPPTPEDPPTPLTLAAHAATLEATLDRSRARWSFTAITRAAEAASADTAGGEVIPAEDAVHGAIDHPDPTSGFGNDEGQPIREAPDDLDASRGDAAAAPDDHTAVPADALARLPGGAAFGSLVHAVFEHLDFTSPTLTNDLDAAIDAELRWRLVDLTPRPVTSGAPEADAPSAEGGRALLRDGLLAAIDTPLGPFAGDRPLRSVARHDRLDELDFELHLPTGASTLAVAELAEIVLDHLPADDPYRPWAHQLAGQAPDVCLGGHLNGSIDLVLRLGSGTDASFVVVDYKTNRLPRPDAPILDAPYGPAALVEAMGHSHYPLQALLYAVALHRFLRWRLPGYRPEVHLGGVAYLFVRGMTGPQVPRHDGQPEGVARWAVPPELVVALSNRFAADDSPATPNGLTSPNGPDARGTT